MRRRLKLFIIFLLILSIIPFHYKKGNVILSNEKMKIDFHVWLSNPIKNTESDIVFYLPIETNTGWCMRGTIIFPESVNDGRFETYKPLIDEYVKQILLNGISVYDWKSPEAIVFGFSNFGTENEPIIRFYLSSKKPFKEFRLYFPKILGIKFQNSGEFSIKTRILVSDDYNNWYETSLIESQKFMIFENLP